MIGRNSTRSAAWGLEFGGSAVRLAHVVRTASAYRLDRFVEAPLEDRWVSSPDIRAALERMGPQTAAHLVIIVLILLGNFLHWRRQRRQQSTPEKEA